MSWYRSGTISVTTGSTNVRGSGTAWSVEVKPGDILTLNNDQLYMVERVIADGELVIWPAWAGATATAAAYSIIRNFTSTTNADLARRMSDLVTRWQRRENEMIEWLAGTPTGGPNGDGAYPLTDLKGVTKLVKCPAWINTILGDPTVQMAEEIVIGLRDAVGEAVDSAATAAREAVSAIEAAADALASKTAAAQSQVLASSSATSAASSQNAAAISAAAAELTRHETGLLRDEARRWAAEQNGLEVANGLFSARNYAERASQSASGAAQSATTAAARSTAAEVSAAAAQISANDAARAAQEAGASSQTAGESAAVAQSAAAAANANKVAAANSAESAVGSEEMARAWSEAPEDVMVESEAYSAKHHAAKAAASASAAAASRAAARTSEANAKASEVGAAAAAAAAQVSQADSSVSKSAAAESEAMARDWAIKTGAPVSGSEHSAKHHAQAAGNAASAAGASAGDAASAAHTARDWATKTTGAVEGDERSAKHHALNAAADAADASESAAAARASREAAAASAGSAATSEVAAGSSRVAAALSQAEAVAARNMAQRWAQAPVNEDVDGTGTRSAYHWAMQATSSLTGQLVWRGLLDASSGVYPASPATGDYYRISVAGSFPDFDVDPGDALIYGGAADGWQKLDNTESVSSVSGRVGVVTTGHILTDLKTIDGEGSGLDADLLDGREASDFAAAGHHHDASYAPAAHVGSGGSAHTPATSSAAGFMSAADKGKLDGIATNANNYVHPTGDGQMHVPAIGVTNARKVLTAGASAGALGWSFVSWADLLNKPTTLAGFGITDGAPAVHTHGLGDVTGLQAALAGKLDVSVYTATDVLAKLATVDGAGSGLDADLLDGHDATHFATAAGLSTKLNSADFTGAQILHRLLPVDGHNSGLDADTLDGRHASEFASNFNSALDGLGGSSASFSYNAAGDVERVVDTVFGKTRTTTYSYAGGFVSKVTRTYDGTTRTETYNWQNGNLVSIATTES